jgi:hypothetical protein
MIPHPDLVAAVAREHQVLPAAVNDMPSMMSYDERALLHWAAREASAGPGMIVDAGCFLGGSTLPLGLGLLQRQPIGDSAKAEVKIHSFDIFQVGAERERVYFDESFPFEIGASTREIYERNIAPVRDSVIVHAGDINRPAAWDEEISLLFIDIAKSWTTNETVTSRFFPHLLPGAIVIQQDLVHFGHPWIALTMELLSDHFEYLGFIPFGSAVYQVKTPISPGEIPSQILSRVSADETLRLINRCAGRIGVPYEGFVRLAGACALGYHHQPARAQKIIDEVAHDYTNDTLPWISEHVAMASEFLHETGGDRAAG